jgi:hypothetical protein
VTADGGEVRVLDQSAMLPRGLDTEEETTKGRS